MDHGSWMVTDGENDMLRLCEPALWVFWKHLGVCECNKPGRGFPEKWWEIPVRFFVNRSGPKKGEWFTI